MEAGASDDAGSLRQENLGMTKDNKLMRDDNVRKEASLKQLPAELGKLTAINHARKSSDGDGDGTETVTETGLGRR